MSEQNTNGEKKYFQLYIDAYAAMNSARDTLTAALCAINDVEDDLINESLGDETISALYGIRSIIRNCRDNLTGALAKEEAASMSANLQ